MNRHILLRNALSAAGQTLVQTAVLFLLYRYLIDRLGIERLGVWAVVLATASVARISELGLAGSVTKFVSGYRARGDDRSANEALQTAAISLATVLGVILLAIYPALTWLLPHVLPAGAVVDGLAILPYALLSMWLAAVSGIWLSGLDACLRSDLRAALVILSTFLFFALALIAVPSHGLVGLAAAQVGQGAVLAVLGWIALSRVMRPASRFPVQWSRAKFTEMLGYGVNLQIITVVMLLFEPTTKVLLARYAGLAPAGHFELAQQLVMKVRALIVEANRVVVPVLAHMEGLGRDARGFYSTNIRYLFLLLTPLFASLAAFIPGISELWIGRYESQFVIMAIGLTIAWYINSLTAPTYFAYLGQGKLRWVTISHVIQGVSNAVLGLTLGPAFGWQGVIAAFVVSVTIGSLMPVWTYHREHQLELRTILSRSDVVLAALCIGAAATALAGYRAALVMDTHLWTRLALVAAVTAAMLAATALHPLAPEVLQMVKGRGARNVDRTL